MREWNPLLYDRWQALFEGAGFAPETAPQPPDHHILLGLIADGRGFALIPESLRNIQRKGVVFRPLREGKALSIGMALAWPEHGRSPALAGLLELVRAALRKEHRG